MIPYARQSINQQDIDAVIDVLQSDFLTQGPAVGQFEKSVTRYTGAQFAVAANSATSALHLACRALELGENDWLWTSPISFVASANCALYCGAQVDFVDIDIATGNLSVEALENKLEHAESAGRLPKIIVPVHFAGMPCDMAQLHELSQRYGFSIIEDAAHALGARYQNGVIGNCEYSDITVFSFHPIKSITTAEGGMALTNQAQLAQKMRLLSSHGITRDRAEMMPPIDGPWSYQQLSLGFNYRMSDLHAALGVSQMQRLEQFIDQRRQRAARYDAEISTLPIHLPTRLPDSHSAWHLYVIRLEEEAPLNRLQLFGRLQHEGIGVNVHYQPIYRQPYYQKMGFSPQHFPNSEKFYRQVISLPLFPDLTSTDQGRIIACLQTALSP